MKRTVFEQNPQGRSRSDGRPGERPNGPGEMAAADFGYAGAPGKINLYVGKTAVEFDIPKPKPSTASKPSSASTANGWAPRWPKKPCRSSVKRARPPAKTVVACTPRRGEKLQNKIGLRASAGLSG